jgi:hypothetical protein
MDPAADDLPDVTSRVSTTGAHAEGGRPFRYFVIELLIVTAGVLIALSVDSLREWNEYRMLVREARANIARELVDNKKEVDASLNEVATRKANIRNALTLANDLLTTRKSDIQQFQLGFSLAEVSAASWQSAERTGALGHMEYAEVQKYSRLYAFQELYAAQQREAVQRISAAIAILSDTNPHEALPDDLRAFRQHLLVLGGELEVERQLATRLSELYAEALK